MQNLTKIAMALVAVVLLSPTGSVLATEEGHKAEDRSALRAENLAWIEADLETHLDEDIQMDTVVKAMGREGPASVSLSDLYNALLDSMPVEVRLSDLSVDVKTVGGTGEGPIVGNIVYFSEYGFNGCMVEHHNTGAGVETLVSATTAPDGGGVVYTWSDIVTGGFDASSYTGALSLTGSSMYWFCFAWGSYYFGGGVSTDAVGVAGGPDSSGVPSIPDPDSADEIVEGAAECATTSPSGDTGVLGTAYVEDVYCLVHTGTVISYSMDTANPANAADLKACLFDGQGIRLTCSDDAVACTHTPPSGYWCPSGTLEAAPGVYYLAAGRFDWSWEPANTEYVFTFASDGVASHMAQLADDQAQQYT